MSREEEEQRRRLLGGSNRLTNCAGLSDVRRVQTFQVQVLGSVDALTGGGGVHLQRVSVAVVPGDGNIVPLIVIQRPLTFALDEVGSVPKVKYIVDVSVGKWNIYGGVCSSQS